MNNPVRLEKKITLEERIEAWANAHAFLLLSIAIVTLFFLFVWLCFALVGISAVDSGVTYNHLQDVI
jgi:hypothetical protein